MAVEQFHSLKREVLNARKEKSTTRLPKSSSGTASATDKYFSYKWLQETRGKLQSSSHFRLHGNLDSRGGETDQASYARARTASAVIEHVMARSCRQMGIKRKVLINSMVSTKPALIHPPKPPIPLWFQAGNISKTGAALPLGKNISDARVVATQVREPLAQEARPKKLLGRPLVQVI